MAKSTHAGIPWLHLLREQLRERVHIWPFDGWDTPRGRSAIVEVYPALWNKSLPQGDRTVDQHDAYCIAASLSAADRNGALPGLLHPSLSPSQRQVAQVEGWILGVPGDFQPRP